MSRRCSMAWRRGSPVDSYAGRIPVDRGLPEPPPRRPARPGGGPGDVELGPVRRRALRARALPRRGRRAARAAHDPADPGPRRPAPRVPGRERVRRAQAAPRHSVLGRGRAVLARERIFPRRGLRAEGRGGRALSGDHCGRRPRRAQERRGRGPRRAQARAERGPRRAGGRGGRPGRCAAARGPGSRARGGPF